MDLSRHLAQIATLETQLDHLLTEQKPSAELAQSIGRLSDEKQKLHYQIDILKRAIQREQKEASENDVLSDFVAQTTASCSGKSSTEKVLPKVDARNVMITSALPYVNNVPHLGNIIGCVLSADVYARYCRVTGANTLYICGTDEYGTATETKARQEGLSCREICDKYNALHEAVYEWFNISMDHFGRTSTQKQQEIVHEIFADLDKNDMLLEKTVQQLYSPELPGFLADRFVEGTCPKPECAYEDARGDQCDKCGGLIDAIDLINPRCKFTGCKPEIRSSKHLYINLTKLMPEIEAHFNGVRSEWSNNARHITESWLKKGLEPRCITRDLKWGIPVPKPGFEEKVFYVWFDAPIGYPSITAAYTDEWRQWWFKQDDKKIEYYQFMGKDNVPFHSIIFPSFLLGTRKPWNLVDNIQGTEYLNYENGKFSKSRGVGVFGNQAQQTKIPSDVWRFYLLYVRPEVQDTEFQWVDFQTKNNSELLNNLGNFVNRAISFLGKFYEHKVPLVQINGAQRSWSTKVHDVLNEYRAAMDQNCQRDALRCVLAMSRLGNQLIQQWQPWVKVKKPETKQEADSCVMLAANLSLLLSAMLEPFMPDTSAEIARQLNAKPIQLPKSFGAYLPASHKVNDAVPLFRKLEDAEIKDYRDRFAGAQPKTESKEIELEILVTGKDESKVGLIEGKVTEQGDKVRKMKADKADKKQIEQAVNVLKHLKAQLAMAKGEAVVSGKKKANK